MTTEATTLLSEADELERRASVLRQRAGDLRRAELRAKPLHERLIYAAHTRCACGAGMAYDPASEGKPDSPHRGPTQWECGDILRFGDLSPDEQERVKSVGHTQPLPFAFYEVKSENQPSANGATTRPQEPRS